MPKPRKGEKRDDFVKRCIPFVIREGKAKGKKVGGSQATAICHGLFDQAKLTEVEATKGNCGTGSGGFKPGNTCGGGGGGASGGASGGSGGGSSSPGAKATSAKVEKETLAIAKKNRLVGKHGDLKTRKGDDDFFEVHVGDVKKGLGAAYNAGRKQVGGRASKADNVIKRIAKTELSIDDLSVKNSDSHDFKEVATWTVKTALTQAWRNGENDALRAAKKKKTKDYPMFNLDILRERETTDGIMTADRYVKGFLSCSEGDALCPAKIFDMEATDFNKMVEGRAGQLVYVEPTVSLKVADDDMVKKAIELTQKKLGDDGANADDIVKKCLAVFENVMSTHGEDRDGDLMHVKGMDVDANMPLLWMHMQIQPLGPFFGVTHRDDMTLKGCFGIAATKMGEDVVTLAEVGALRTSIGFNPVEGQVVPRKTAQVMGKKKVLTWEVKACKVMEDSLVSVPSCEDAVITAFSRKSLRHELVNHWAKSFYDAREKIHAGVDVPDDKPPEGELETKQAETETPPPETVEDKIKDLEAKVDALVAKGCPEVVAKSLNVEQLDSLLADEVEIAPGQVLSTIEETERCTFANHGQSLESKMYGMNEYYMPGSYEWLMEKLQKQAAAYMVGQGVLTETDRYVGIVATFEDEVLLAFGPYEEKQCYLVGYTKGEDGMPKLTGEATEVEIKAEIVAKWLELWDSVAEADGEPSDPPEEKAVDLARRICAKMVDGDETVADAINIMLHANDVFQDHDEKTLYGVATE